MDSQLAEFAEEYIADGTQVANYKQSRNISTLFGFLSFTSLFLWFVRHQLINLLPQTLSLPDWGVLIIPLLLGLVGYIVRRGRKSMNIDSSVIALHELSESVKACGEQDATSTTTHFKSFAEEINRASNELFSEKKENLAEEYAERLEESEDKQSVLNNTFEEFVSNLVDNLRDEETLSETVGKVEDQSEINTSSLGIISESFGAVGVDRYVLYSIVMSVIGVALFYYVDEQLGMLSLAALSPIVNILSGRKNY